MSDAKQQDRNARIGLSRPSARIELKAKTVESGTVRQSFSHGRSKAVAVEVKRRRVVRKGPAAETQQPAEPAQQAPATAAAETPTATPAARAGAAVRRERVVLKTLTEEEKAARARALAEARKAEEEARARAEEIARRAREEAERRRAEEEAAAKRKAEEEARRKAEEEARRKAEEMAKRLLAEEEAKRRAEEEAKQAAQVAEEESRREAGPRVKPAPPAEAGPGRAVRPEKEVEEEEVEREAKRAKGRPKVEKRAAPKRLELRETKKPLRVILSEDEEEERVRSLAALKRQRERERQKQQQRGGPQPVVREVVIPEAITVQELAARMAVRGAEVVKVLMKNGIMATLNQTIDADTAELVVTEFGHVAKRVSEADVEEGLEGAPDRPEDLVPRPPVVTVMGHVDHGKTSLLDALRQTDVAAHEAGGITQHIGAYRVDIGSGMPVTFIDTPGHEAFTAMRARGASVTDIVVLVVAADDGVMPQTVEAIRHAQAANVPIIVAINKIDKPDADPDRVKTELLNHGVVLEEFGGDVLAVPVSAVRKIGLEQLIEAIQLQAELLDLEANPNREAHGTIIEARLDRGRGPVATVLVQNGTLRVGDIVVAGAHWGRVRALIDDRGQQVQEAGPSVPVEILGLDGVPEAGDRLVAVDSEKRAKEIAEYRQRKKREQEQRLAAAPRSSLEEMFAKIREGELARVPVVVKADVHGSLEAIRAGLEKLSTEEVGVQILHAGVGAITESDISLAKASGALVIGFNVRANAPARELAKREGVEIRYYSIIYELLDDVKKLLEGRLAPEEREQILGHAEIREVFSIPKVGKVAGCMVTDGLVRRNARIRLLRDGVVVFEGTIASLRRFKEDVREVREGYECGIGIEGYNDIRQGDVIEAYEVQEVARTLDA
jgi:translation initiation factor IF-2